VELPINGDGSVEVLREVAKRLEGTEAGEFMDTVEGWHVSMILEIKIPEGDHIRYWFKELLKTHKLEVIAETFSEVLEGLPISGLHPNFVLSPIQSLVLAQINDILADTERWTIVDFGKHKGLSLPQILFTDPDWFFWALEEDALSQSPGYAALLSEQAQELYSKARLIAIPKKDNITMMAENIYDPMTGRYDRLEIVPATQKSHEGASPTLRREVIDMLLPRDSNYNKAGFQGLLEPLSRYVLGKDLTTLTKEDCESFFANNTNFITGGDSFIEE
tara:strand:- start:107 stop:934 length:828 start_codon:yes stop_codon:yes gene_type:complete